MPRAQHLSLRRSPRLSISKCLSKAAADNVIVLGRTLARVKSTGKKFDSEWIHVFTFKDGKLERFQEFYDTAVIVEAFAA